MTHDTSSTVTMDRDAADALVRSWLALWNGDYAVAETIVSENNRVHAAMLDGGDGSAVAGVAGMKDFVAQTRSISADLAFSVDVGPLVDGDHIVLRWVATGPYGGGLPGAGAAVGTEVTITGTDILRISDNQIVEYWLNADTLSLMAQLQVGAG